MTYYIPLENNQTQRHHTDIEAINYSLIYDNIDISINRALETLTNNDNTISLINYNDIDTLRQAVTEVYIYNTKKGGSSLSNDRYNTHSQ